MRELKKVTTNVANAELYLSEMIGTGYNYRVYKVWDVPYSEGQKVDTYYSCRHSRRLQFAHEDDAGSLKYGNALIEEHKKTCDYRPMVVYLKKYPSGWKGNIQQKCVYDVVIPF